MLRRSLIVASLFLAESAIATPLPLDPHLCYMQKSNGQVVNLGHLCGKGEIALPVIGVAPTTATTSTRATSSGKCTFSGDRDSRGNLCGGRASVRRKGGR